MSDADPLAAYVEAWRSAAGDVVALLRTLDTDDWDKPTDLPGWTVRHVAAHLAHVESELAGNPQQDVDIPQAAHIKGLMGQFTEAGPLARGGWTKDQVIDELEQSVAARSKELTDNPPTDAKAPGPGFAALIGWSWETLLSNRPLDLWMHEQDIRRAVGRPGGLDSAGARHVAAVFARSLPYVVGKKVAAAPGTTVVLHVTGDQERTVAVGVNDDGRGAALDAVPPDPSATITLDFESWIVLAGGRRTASQVEAEIEGDEQLGQKVLDSLAVTP